MIVLTKRFLKSDPLENHFQYFIDENDSQKKLNNNRSDYFYTSARNLALFSNFLEQRLMVSTRYPYYSAHFVYYSSYMAFIAIVTMHIVYTTLLSTLTNAIMVSLVFYCHYQTIHYSSPIHLPAHREGGNVHDNNFNNNGSHIFSSIYNVSLINI